MECCIYKIDSGKTLLFSCEAAFSSDDNMVLLEGNPAVHQYTADGGGPLRGRIEEDDIMGNRAFRCGASSTTLLQPRGTPFTVELKRGWFNVRGFDNDNRAHENPAFVLLAHENPAFVMLGHESRDCFDFFMRNDVQLFFSTDHHEVSLERLLHCPEAYGCKLAEGERYEVQPYSEITLYTPTLAKVRVRGLPRFLAVMPCPDRSVFTMFNDHLNFLRSLSRGYLDEGPRILVVGPREAYNTAICRFLVNNAVQYGKRPVFVDLNVCANSVTIPGAVGLLRVEEECHLTKGYSGERTVIPFGHTLISKNAPRYYLIIKEVATMLKDMFQADDITRFSGSIAVCSQLIRKEEIWLLAKQLGIDTMVVTAEYGARYGDLDTSSPPEVHMHYFPPEHMDAMGFELDQEESYKQRMNEYFYGTRTHPRTPFLQDVNFDEVFIYAIVPRYAEHQQYKEYTMYDLELRREYCTVRRLRDRILAVSLTTRFDRRMAFAKGKYFVRITDVDEENARLTFMSPYEESLTEQAFVVMDQSLLKSW